MRLRKYQHDMICGVRMALSRNRRAVLQAPTGSGKTAVACEIIKQASDKGKSIWFVVHQNELLQQTSKALWRNKVPHGWISAKAKSTPHNVQLVSILTVINRLNTVAPPDLIIIDEAHRALANSYVKVIERFPAAYVIGLTATPQRTDKKGLGHIFNEIVEGPKISHLINKGYLCDYELYTLPNHVNTDGMKKRGGDYAVEALEPEVNKSTVTGDAVEHYRKLAYGRKCVVLCVSVKHAEAVAEQYNEAGVPALCVHGETKNRDDVLDSFERGDFLILTSVNLLIEGVDIPIISCIQMLRPTQSLVVYMQAIGRGFRPHPKKENLIILDHVGNYVRHGSPDLDRVWSLEGDAKLKDSKEFTPRIGTKHCEVCHFEFASTLPACDKCGALWVPKERVLKSVEGELAKVEKEKIDQENEVARKEARKKQGMAKTLSELVAQQTEQGIDEPWKRAAIIFARRKKRKPVPLDFNQAKRAYHEQQRNTR